MKYTPVLTAGLLLVFMGCMEVLYGKTTGLGFVGWVSIFTGFVLIMVKTYWILTHADELRRDTLRRAKTASKRKQAK